jgi:hypothetical protein
MCHTIPRRNGDNNRINKCGRFYFAKEKLIYNRLIEKFDPKFSVNLGKSGKFPAFLIQLIFPISPSERVP